MDEMAPEAILIDLRALYGDTAKLADVETYKRECLSQAGDGREVVLTGQGPV